jgi:DNA uptake protein ComE-like DNA-binding protein
VVIGLLSAVVVYVTVRLILNPTYVSDPQPPVPSRAHELEDRIDPNTADAHTLAALPQIGLNRAQDIVEYRERFVAENPGQVAFTKPADLMRIRGFGVAMVSHVEPYLFFPKATTTSAPAH